MPKNKTLRAVAELVQDVALFCGEIKPALLEITAFLVFFVGLVTIASALLRLH